MAADVKKPSPPPEVLAYYASYPEESRLLTGPGRLEFERTKEILARVLPKAPGRILDVGGAAGVYSAWLADLGYEVHLLDATPRLVEEARRRNEKLRRPIASLSAGDARSLPHEDGWAAVVLLMGPLYHLTAAEDRLAALRQAHRVLAAPGLLIAAAISRYSSALVGLTYKLSLDPQFIPIRDRDLAYGQHRNATGNPDYFTTAYLHRPEDLRAEMVSAGFGDVEVFGVEGVGWMLPDFDDRWADPAQRKDMLDVARALESEPSIVGLSSHLIGTARKA